MRQFLRSEDDKCLTDSIMFVYTMLAKEEGETKVEPIELQEYIRELQKDESLLNKIDNICFELLTAIQDRCMQVNEVKLKGLTYDGVIELVGKICVFLIRRDNKSQLAAGSVEDGEVSEPVATILSYPDKEGNMIEGMLAVVHGYTREIKAGALNAAVERGVADFLSRYPDEKYTIRINPWTREGVPEDLSERIVDDTHVPNGYVWVCRDG